MKDGKRPRGLNTYTKLSESEDGSNIEAYPFMNRDPRFYRTFAMPGFRWTYTGDPVPADAFNPSYNDGKDYVLWNYVWYADAKDITDVESGNAYGADNLLKTERAYTCASVVTMVTYPIHSIRLMQLIPMVAFLIRQLLGWRFVMRKYCLTMLKQLAVQERWVKLWKT